MQNFFRNVYVTMRGALIGQVIPVIAMPFISRLYGPQEFGLYASLLSISVVLAAVMMLQMEVAVVLPEDEKEGTRVARSAAQIGACMFAGLTVLMLALYPFLDHFRGLAELSWWIILAPLLGLAMAFVLLGNYAASRLQNYAEIGFSSAAMQFTSCVLTLLLGLLKPGAAGLVIGRMAGQAAGIAAYVKSMKWLVAAFKKDGALSWGEIKAVLKEYRKFPMFTLPRTLLSMLARECVPILLIFFHYPIAAGFYALVRAIFMMPVSLLSTSIGQIFYRDASRGADKAEFQAFTFSLMIAIACIVTPGCIYIAGNGPALFSMIFGGNWENASIYAMIFMPAALLFILTGWCQRIFEVRHKQDLAFRINFVFDIMSIAALIAALVADVGPAKSVAVYLVCQMGGLGITLLFIFRLLNLRVFRLALLLGIAGAAGIIQSLVHKGLAASLSGTAALAAETAFIAVLGVATIGWFWRSIGRKHLLAKPDQGGISLP